MEESAAGSVEERSGGVICVTEKLSDLRLLDQLGSVWASGGQTRCDDGQTMEECSSMEQSACHEFRFRVQQQQDAKVVDMAESFWGDLPEHLIHIILAKLPVFGILRLRSVCKRWNALTSNPAFLQNYSPAQSAPVVFLLYADQARQRYPIYDPASNAWHLLPLTLNSSPPGNSSSSFVVLAAAGGLLCLTDVLSDLEDGILNLYVSNPITRASRRLPPTIWMPMSKPYVVGMVVDSVKNTYKILVARNGDDLKLQLYDSARGLWEMTDSVLRRLALIVGTAYTQGILYCFTFGTVTSVSAYHIDRGSLEDVPAPMPSHLACPQLFVSRGNLMMVGATALWGVMTSICIWQLDSLLMEWVEVLRVPDDLLPELSRGGDTGAYNLFVADGDYICFVSCRSKKMFMCNVFKKSWWWSPLCPFDTGGYSLNLSGFPLQPSLVASV